MLDFIEIDRISKIVTQQMLSRLKIDKRKRKLDKLKTQKKEDD